MLDAASALLPTSVARVVAQDVSHRLRGDGAEMRTTRGRRVLLSCHLEIDLVHERGGVERNVTVPPSSLLAGQCPELVVDERKQRIQSLAVATLGCLQQSSDSRVWRCLAHPTVLLRPRALFLRSARSAAPSRPGQAWCSGKLGATPLTSDTTSEPLRAQGRNRSTSFPGL